MKRILFVLSILISSVAFSQSKGYFRYDSTIFEKGGGNNELIIKNGTRSVTGGVLTNMGNGRTAFVLAAPSPSGGDSLSVSFTPNLLDTMETKSIVSGAATTKDNTFPNALFTNAGTVLVGIAQTRSHSFAGVNSYLRSATQGLTYSAITALETDTNYNYRNLIFSKGRNDTIFAHYWAALNNRIYHRYSVNDGVTWSAKDSLSSALNLATENEIRIFGDYYVMPVYSFAPSANQTGIAYTTDLSGGTWTISMLPAGWDAYEFNEADLVVEGDTLFLFARSEVEPDSLYRFYTLNKTSWSTVPVVSRPPEWFPGKPDILRMPDGRYLMNYRTEDGSAPNEGVIAISNDRGTTWTKLYEQTQATFTYGSTINIGGDRYLNVHSCMNDPAPYGTVYQHIYVIPRKDLLNTDKIAYDNFGANWNWTKHIIDKSDSVLRGAYYGTGYLNVRMIANTVGSGINIYHSSTNNNASLSHVNNIFSIATALAASPTVREIRARFYEPTSTGTDRIFDIGDDHFIGFQDGTIKSQKPYLNHGGGIFRIENTGNTAPTGSTGVGHEWFIAGGAAYWNPLNRSTLANAPGEIVTSALGITGTVTIKSAMNFNAGVVLQMQGSAGTSGQILSSTGAGTTPQWITPSALTGYKLNNLAGADGANNIDNGDNGQSWTWNTLTTGPAMILSSNNTTISNGGGLFSASLQGANAASGVTSYAASFTNSKTGTSSTNRAALFSASGGTTNQAIYVTAGSVEMKNGLVGVGGQYHKNITDVGNVGAGEDDLMTKSVDAGLLATDEEALEFVATFTVTGDGTLKMYFGATQLFSVAATSGNGNYEVTGRIVRTGSATQKATGHINMGLGDAPAFRAAPTETLSGAVTFKATFEGTSNNDGVQTYFDIKWTPAK